MRNYELTAILRPQKADSLQEKVKEILQKHTVKIVKDDSWGVKKLAYEVSGETEGFYMFLIIEATPEIIKSIIADFRLNSDILRYFFAQMKQTA